MAWRSDEWVGYTNFKTSTVEIAERAQRRPTRSLSATVLHISDRPFQPDLVTRHLRLRIDSFAHGSGADCLAGAAAAAVFVAGAAVVGNAVLISCALFAAARVS